MIRVYIYLDENKNVQAFKVNNHGNSVICAAVSALTINAANSIEKFCEEDFTCNFDGGGGFFSFALKTKSEKALLLLNSLLLGLKKIKKEYPKDITIIIQEVQPC